MVECGYRNWLILKKGGYMRKGFRKKYYTLSVIAGMAFAMIGVNTGTVSAEESGTDPEEYVGGFIPVDKEIYVVPESGKTTPALRGTKTYPERYRSDEEPWAEGIRVKDQASSGLCWAFSTSSACEYSYAKEMYETTGEIATVEELSPGHLAQFFYNRVVDPLGNTAGDMNSLPPEDHWATTGGNAIFAMQHMAGWSGMASEEKAPIGKVLEHIKNYDWDGSIAPYSADLAYEDVLVLQESKYFTRPDMDTMKDLVLQYGAFSIAVEYDNRYLNLDEIDPETGEAYVGGRSFYNTSSNPQHNHAVTLIGWDDDYPKENFRREIPGNNEEDPAKVVEPENNGAWIIQNSWGTVANDGGFFYMSYESAEFLNDYYIIAFDMQPADTYQYNFHYDGTAGSADASDRDADDCRFGYYTTPGTGAANVFTNNTGHPIEIGAVGYTTFNLGLTYYDVSVYTGLTDPLNPESGTFAGTTRISSTVPGCKTAELDAPVVVAPGENYSVVFSFPDFAAFGTERFYNRGFIFQASISEGQSFFRQAASQNWQDMADYEACFRIKAFANVYEDTTAPEIVADSLGFPPEAKAQVLSGDKVAIALQVKDDLAVDRVTVVFEAESTKKTLELSLSQSEASTDQWDGELEITESTALGAWHVKEIRAVDIMGNEAVLYNNKLSEQTPAADLSAVSFNVSKPEDPDKDKDKDKDKEKKETIRTGWQKEADGKWYYFNADGSMAKGWFRYKSKWYYLTKSGAMAKGWKKIGTAWYYFKADGAMASKEWIRGFWLDRDGCWTYEPKASWRKTKKGWWYGDTSGWYAKKQWQKIDGTWYYFDASGYMVTGRQVIDGKTYTFGGDGAYIK